MDPSAIRPGIFWVGVNDRITDLFEGQWPLPHGVSYNAYLVVGERVALVDGVKAPFGEELLRCVAEVVPPERIAYLIVNHLEPDHSGSLPLLRRVAPGAEVLATKAALPLLDALYGIRDRVRAVSDGETLDLGGKRLSFYAIPFVHWPETMATYEETERILFSCDAFGGFGALDGVLFDDEADLAHYEGEAVRYYTNIVGAVSKPVLRAIDKLGGLPIEVIAPSHGLVWRRDPRRIVDLYGRLARMEGEPAVTVLYGSMYDHTREMADAVARGVTAAGVPVRVVDAARVHPSTVLTEVWRRKGLILGSPTYDSGIFPAVEHALRLVVCKRLANRVVGLFGSLGWQGGAVRKMADEVAPLGWDLVDKVEFKGAPRADDLARGDELGRAVAERVRG
ncbi:MAG: Flavoprotein [Candidatus Bipolaricaulis sibiricus]|uniref:Flavoprotein n=1 Tax=Bipolaricaulis sibiricus TaxID=2501609 RepID=A0A410FSJ5_BIPS1|nr:MAG: Flavoprotein [Candidatus Bipolaricaulis sibiricus]